MSTADVALILLLVVIKIPIVGWMLWLPFREDQALAFESEGSGPDEDEDDGGGGGPRRRPPHRRPPWPVRPRRGPHGQPAPASPPRVRATARRLGQRIAR